MRRFRGPQIAALMLMLVATRGQAQGLQYGASTGMADASQSALTSPALATFTERIAEQNKRTAASVTDATVEQSQRLLPKLTQLSGELKYGKHNVVSKDGDVVVGLIRASIAGPQQARESNLRELEARAANGSPEATNFLGFVAEHGLFGRPKSFQSAARHYEAAARKAYQPALFNQALILAYGRTGKVDVPTATRLLDRAASLGRDESQRLCGFGSFLHYRVGNENAALRHAEGCTSPLARLPMGLWRTAEPMPRRVEWLRMSLSTGVDDAYRLLEQVTARSTSDTQFMNCKYSILNRARAGVGGVALREYAERCYDAHTAGAAARPAGMFGKSTAVSSIVAFAGSEAAAIERSRRSNRFHFSWGVPYLPFGQAEVELFAEAIQKGSR